MSVSQELPGDSSVRHLFDQSRSGPTALRILLGTQLRCLRETRGITREAAAEAIRSSASKISRIERGRVACKTRDVGDLLSLYGVIGGDERADVLTLARQAGTPGWWHQYNDVLPGWFELYLGLEGAASRIRTYEVQFVPGLLQTQEYARAVVLLGHPGAPEDELQQRVSLRMRRQRILTQPGAPKLWAVVDEAALLRRLGGPGVMEAQLRHLIEITKLPNITLNIVPLRTEDYGAVGGSFTILRFAEPELPDVVYLEQLTSALYLDKRRDIECYTAVMDQLCVRAETRVATAEILNQILDGMS